MLSALAQLAERDRPVALLAHPRLVAACEKHGLTIDRGKLRAHKPLSYPDLIRAAMDAKGIVTDSGGLQKEAFLLRVPCTTVRPETEWVETVECGWNVLVEPGDELVTAAMRPTPEPTDITPYGDGSAAKNVVSVLRNSKRS